VARRHGLSPSQLFTWRRQVRDELEAQGIAVPADPAEVPPFVPAAIEAVTHSDAAPARRTRRRRRSHAAVELEINGVAVKIGRGADATLIAAVIEALKS
jgi:transposase